MALERKKMITKWLQEMLTEQHFGTTDPKNKVIARELINMALDPGNPAKLRLEAIEVILDRLEGKPMQTNLNADIVQNPFDGIDTKKLEEMKAKLLDAK